VSDEYLTIPEVAELLRITERTAYSLAREGKLPAMKVGNRWRVARATLEEWSRTGGLPPSVDAEADGSEGGK